jgi:ABC-type nitrate/sulfonate/bicarbonate transport system substrate-binding protein
MPILRVFAALLITLGGAVDASTAQAAPDLPVLKVTVFEAPSQSAWIPTLIQKQGLDVKNGFRLEVVQKQSQVAYTELATGADPVCYCAAPAAVARFVQQGSDITLLWNIFDFDAFIVASDPNIRNARDLEGRTLATDTVTGNWAVASWFLRQQGVDFSKVTVKSGGRGMAAVAEISAGRVDALVVNSTDASGAITASEGKLRALPIYNPDVWHKYAPNSELPAISFGVWRSWIAKADNAALVQRFYAANLEAAAFVKEKPQEAAAIIATDGGATKEALIHNLTTYGTLLNIRPISDYRDAIAVLTQKLMPEAGQLDRPMTKDELDRYVSDFQP